MSIESMKNMTKLSFGEDLANAITHGVMALIFLFALPYAAIVAYLKGGVLQSVGVSIFCISIFMMLLASTLYHSMAYDTKHKVIFRIFDHIFIFVAIAGSYTPIALSLIKGWQGFLILIIQWLMVIIGIFYKSVAKKEIPKLSLTLYMIMGWTAVLFIPVLLKTASLEFLFFIVLGGVFYSIGACFYVRQAKKYNHMIWHLFINLASIAHFIAIVYYI